MGEAQDWWADLTWEKKRRIVLARDENRCAYCSGEADTVDHQIPRAMGGSDAFGNLVAACQPCNSRKGAHTAMPTIDAATIERLRRERSLAEEAQQQSLAAWAELHHAVAQHLADGHSATQVARDLGVSRGRVYQWRDKAR